MEFNNAYNAKVASQYNNITNILPRPDMTDLGNNLTSLSQTSDWLAVVSYQNTTTAPLQGLADLTVLLNDILCKFTTLNRSVNLKMILEL